jgi:hypothetical protein
MIGEKWKVRQDGTDWELEVIASETLPCGCVMEKIERRRPGSSTWWSRRLLPDPAVHRRDHMKR